jgi:hypothetical protein
MVWAQIAAGTPTIIQPNANPRGIWGNIRFMGSPRQDPTNNRGNIGPPMKPKFNAPLNATNLVNLKLRGV